MIESLEILGAIGLIILGSIIFFKIQQEVRSMKDEGEL